MIRLLTEPQELRDARESLSYWEQRSQRLPVGAIRRRREARVLAQRWSSRVADAERARYGASVLGALLVVLVEGRLPEPTRQAGRRVAHRTARAVMAAALAVVAVSVVAMMVVVALLVAILGALL